MFVEINVLHNFPYTCLNRDGNGEVKQVTFGGTRRARISSQCQGYWKRKGAGEFIEDLSQYDSIRTKYVISLLVEKLDFIKDENARTEWATMAVKAFFDGEAPKKKDKKSDDSHLLTHYMVPTSDIELNAIAEMIKSDISGEIPSPIAFWKSHKKEWKTLAHMTFDIAMRGRMLASANHCAIYGASSAAHAIATHQLILDTDYFAAVDDYKQAHSIPGAGHIDPQSATSACYYEHFSINIDKLIENFGGNKELALGCMGEYIAPLLLITPKGKSGSMNGNVPPSFVLATVGKHQVNLSNAFRTSVYGNDIVAKSVECLVDYYEDMALGFCGHTFDAFAIAEKTIEFRTDNIKRLDGIASLRKALIESLK